MNLSNHLNRNLLISTALISIIILVISLFPKTDFFSSVNVWIKSLGFWGIPAFSLFYILLSILAIPRIALILIAGTMFGVMNGIITVSISDVLGASACFLVGRTVALKKVVKLKRQFPLLRKMDQAIAEQGWKVLLLSRLSPMIPSNILNYGFSCTKVNFWQYLFFTWLGMLPIIFYYVNLGYFGANLFGRENSFETTLFQAGGIIATVFIAFYTTRLAKQVLSES
jgi:uncharacterized membrane protein YdjX (TVP38/TMEM64 family)